MKIIVIYDNNVPKSEVISDIIGEKGFADVVVKKQRIEDYTRNDINLLCNGIIWEKINNQSDYSLISDYIKRFYDEDVRILHYYSNYFIQDSDKVLLSLKKLFYIDGPYKMIFNKKIAGLMFSDARNYAQFCKNLFANQNLTEASALIKNSFEVEGLTDLSQINNFIQCITGNFDSRYFNSFQDNDYTITKTSVDKLKIKKEYTYYQLLPEDMKPWFVIPYNYEEQENTASYTMERLHMTDLAIKYVHGSINNAEFENLLKKYFYFFKMRHARTCSTEKYHKTSQNLFVDKVNSRIQDLKNHTEYGKIKNYLDAANLNIDDLVSRYNNLKEKIENSNKYQEVEVIGHGDPGFANTLYNKATQTLKFIDPKGALTEDEMWTNPYYDIAKLSHCICGKYDFFNNGLFEIKIDENFMPELDIPFNNKEYVDIFKEQLEINGFDYKTVRIYEASLFLSMLPLHMDNPYKVFGFILNANNILKELENDI